MNTAVGVLPSLKQRFLGICIDYLIILLYAAILLSTTLAISLVVTGHIPRIGSLNPWLGELIGFVTLTLPVSLYFILTESGRHQASFGKRAAHIFVTDRRGNKPSLRRIVVRTIVKFLPWELAHVCIQHLIATNQSGQTMSPSITIGLLISNALLLGYLLIIIFRPDHGGPYDIIAETKLVSKTT